MMRRQIELAGAGLAGQAGEATVDLEGVGINDFAADPFGECGGEK